MEHIPAADVEQRFEEYREFTEAIRKSGHLIRLQSARAPPMSRGRSGFGMTKF
jgi:hypothetical protein